MSTGVGGIRVQSLVCQVTHPGTELPPGFSPQIRPMVTLYLSLPGCRWQELGHLWKPSTCLTLLRGLEIGRHRSRLGKGVDLRVSRFMN